MSNPLLAPLTFKDQAIPFNEIKVEHYIPAIQQAILEAKENIASIKSQKETSFDNTIVALEQVSEKVDRISNIYFIFLKMMSSKETSEAKADRIGELCWAKD